MALTKAILKIPYKDLQRAKRARTRKPPVYFSPATQFLTILKIYNFHIILTKSIKLKFLEFAF